MATQSGRNHVIPFAPFPVNVRDAAHQLDQAGQSILQLLDSAAVVAEQNDRRTLNMTQKLLHHLHAAEDRMAELEAEAATYQQERSEQSNGFTEFIRRLKTDFCDARRGPWPGWRSRRGSPPHEHAPASIYQ